MSSLDLQMAEIYERASRGISARGFYPKAAIMTRPRLTHADVIAIRTSGLTDTEWERRLRLSRNTIRAARTGLTHQHVMTPPDTTPRDGNGRGHKPMAQPARQRWSYFHE